MITRLLDQITPSVVSHNDKIEKRILLSHKPNHEECLPVTQFAQAIFPPGESAPGHQHKDMAEVFFVQSGSGEIQVDDTTTALTPGRSILVEPGEHHEIRNTGGDDLVILYFGYLC